jgi:hypothetical protein
MAGRSVAGVAEGTGISESIGPCAEVLDRGTIVGKCRVASKAGGSYTEQKMETGIRGRGNRCIKC